MYDNSTVVSCRVEMSNSGPEWRQGGTLRAILRQAGIEVDEFLRA